MIDLEGRLKEAKEAILRQPEPMRSLLSAYYKEVVAHYKEVFPNESEQRNLRVHL
jgi:hypothetical protein